jgi:hypothetical protein
VEQGWGGVGGGGGGEVRMKEGRGVRVREGRWGRMGMEEGQGGWG